MLRSLCLALAFLGSVYATVYVADNGDDINNDGSPEAPFQTITHALEGTDNDIVLLGTTLSATGNTGLLSTKSLTIRGNDTDAHIALDLSGSTFLKVTSDSDEPLSLSLMYVDFTNGVRVVDVATQSSAGFNFQMTNCSVKSCNITGVGASGPVSLSVRGEATVSVVNCAFEGNSVSSGDGGALYVSALGDSSVTIKDSTFENNFASTYGGAVYASLTHKSKLDISCTEGDESEASFKQNKVGVEDASLAQGGALYVVDQQFQLTAAQQLSVTISECSFSENKASRLGAGAALSGASLTLSQTRFEFNKITNELTGSGGALYLYGGAFNADNACAFFSNHAPSGGGLYMEHGLGGLVRETSWLYNSASVEAMQVFIHSYDILTFDENDFSCQPPYCDPLVGAIVVGNQTTINLDNTYSPGILDKDTNVTKLDSLTLLYSAQANFQSFINPANPHLEIYALTMNAGSVFNTKADLTISENGYFHWYGGSVEGGLNYRNTYDLTILRNATLWLKSKINEQTNARALSNLNLVTNKDSAAYFGENEGLQVLQTASFTAQEESTWTVEKGFTLTGVAVTFALQGKASFDPSSLWTGVSLDMTDKAQLILNKNGPGTSPVLSVKNACFRGHVVMNLMKGALEKGEEYGLVKYSDGLETNCPTEDVFTMLSGPQGYNKNDVLYSFVFEPTLLKLGTEKSDLGMGGGVVAGLVIGLIVCLVSVVAGAYFYWHTTQSKDEEMLVGGDASERYGSTFGYGE